MVDRVEITLQKLNGLYERKLRGPFPYEAASLLVGSDHNKYKELIPNLELYCGRIAGYASSNRERVRGWDKDHIEKIRVDLKHSFFDQYPEYANIQFLSDKDFAPLLLEIAGYERARLILLELVRILSDSGAA